VICVLLRAGKQCADDESDRDQERSTREVDGQVLAVQVGLGAFLNGVSNFLHARIVGGLAQDPTGGADAVKQHRTGTGKREVEFS
jgi:hypothetical protein